MKFRRKLDVVDAIKFERSEDGVRQLKDFLDKESIQIVTRKVRTKEIFEYALIRDRAQQKRALFGQYIIKFSDGSFDVCDAEVFHENFEKIE